MNSERIVASQEVYQKLCAALADAEFPPGAQLVEREVAARLGVSRVPVREALNRLVAEGILLSGGPRGGVRVRHYSASEIQQIIEYRQSLEAGAARLAAQHARDADLTALRKICDQAAGLVGSYGVKRWADLDHRFHVALAQASHNERLQRALELLLTESHFLFYLAPSRERKPRPSAAEVRQIMTDIVQEHRRLVDLIQRGAADEAEQLARQHIVCTRWVLALQRPATAAG